MARQHRPGRAVRPLPDAPSIAILRPDPSWRGRFPDTSHTWDEFIYTQRGTCRFEFPGGAFQLEPGHLVYVPAGCTHDGHWPMDGSAGSILLKHPQPLHLSQQPTRVVDTSTRFLMLLLWMRDVGQDQGWQSGLMRQLVQTFIAGFVDQTTTAPESTTKLTNVVRYLRESLHKPVTLDELCTVAELSRTHLLRRFKAVYGEPPLRMLQRMRVEEACQLIANTSLNLSDIADRVGIGGAAYLSRLIKRHTGRTAREWRA